MSKDTNYPFKLIIIMMYVVMANVIMLSVFAPYV